MASDDKLRLYNTQKAVPNLQPVAQVRNIPEGGVTHKKMILLSDKNYLVWTSGETRQSHWSLAHTLPSIMASNEVPF